VAILILILRVAACVLNSVFLIAGGGARCSVVVKALNATSRNVAGSTLDDVNEFISIYLTFPATLGPGVHSVSNRNLFL
jgi:hypothetical protein